jgi:hypothetical protein
MATDKREFTNLGEAIDFLAKETEAVEKSLALLKHHYQEILAQIIANMARGVQ